MMHKHRYNSVWISDVHLGFRDCKAAFLLTFLESVQCDTLYLVGDLIDLWSLHKGGRWPESHSRVLQAIVVKAAQGTRVVYVPGNHDEAIRRHVGLFVGGVEIAGEMIHETADGHRYLVIHGDEFDGVIRCGSSLVFWLGDWMYDILLFVNRWTNCIRRCFGYPYWSLASAVKRRIGGAVDYISRYETMVAREAARRGLDGVICGHIHKAAIRELEGVVYCNDGDWVESCTALVEHPDGALEILYWADETVVVLQEHRRRVGGPASGLAKAG
jgi:UDP-2,3-diacylglucosamine pyrophosphatase LpxH